MIRKLAEFLGKPLSDAKVKHICWTCVISVHVW
jgi:hypothetical protein